MKINRSLPFLVAALLTTGIFCASELPVHASTGASGLCRDWSTADSWRQGILVTLQAVDWAQTRQFAGDPSDRFEEGNTLLGRKPSPERINLLIGSAIVAHALVSCWLKPEARVHWQMSFIGFEAGAVIHNWSVGVALGF